MNTTQNYSNRQTLRRFSAAVVLAAAVVIGSHVQPPAASVAEELVIVDPPQGFVTTVQDLGFGVTEEASLKSLSLDAFRLRVPAGESNASAVAMLRVHYPELEISKSSFGEF